MKKQIRKILQTVEKRAVFKHANVQKTIPTICIWCEFQIEGVFWQIHTEYPFRRKIFFDNTERLTLIELAIALLFFCILIFFTSKQ